MKPDWKDAPEWANHLAMDENGLWHWFENRPITSSSQGVWYPSIGKSALANQESVPWYLSDEDRPIHGID